MMMMVDARLSNPDNINERKNKMVDMYIILWKLALKI